MVYLAVCAATFRPAEAEKRKRKKKNLQAERIKSSVSDMDTVILRNNMRENGKSSKTCCHSQLSHMRGWRQSLSAASLLQSLLHASAPAAPCCLFNLSMQSHFKNTKRNVGQRSPSSDRDPGKTPSTWEQFISQSGVWINSLPAVQRLVFLLEMFLLRNKGALSAYRNEGETWHTQTKSRPIFLTDLVWLWQKIALVHRLVSALN